METIKKPPLTFPEGAQPPTLFGKAVDLQDSGRVAVGRRTRSEVDWGFVTLTTLLLATTRSGRDRGAVLEPWEGLIWSLVS